VEKKKMISKARAVVLIIIVGLLGGLAPWAAAQPSRSGADRSAVHWESLAFKSSAFLGSVQTRVTLEELPADEVGGILIASPQEESVKPSGPRVFHLTVNSAIDPLIGSDELLVTRVWFSPQASAALQRVRLRKGKELWEKTYRWTASGVYRLRIRPQDADEENLPVKRWTDRQNSFYPYDLQQSECSSVSDPSVLLYVASTAGLAVGDDPRRLCAFNKKQLHLVQFQAEKSQLLKVNYLEKTPDGETRRQGEAEVLKVSFTTRSLFPDEAGAEPFSFLGLKGDFHIFIEKISRIPVQIGGKIPGFGKVAIKLEQALVRPGGK
jgi:hypothetical protein